MVPTWRDARPNSASSADTSGLRAMKASAPTSTAWPPMRSVRSTPPRRSAGSNSVIEASGPAVTRNR